MSTPASTRPPASSENGTVSQLIWRLKSSFRPRDFEKAIQALTARDEAARRDASHWKAQFEAMEKKHGEVALEKLIALDELRKLKDQVSRAESEQRSLIKRLEEDQNTTVARVKEEDQNTRVPRFKEDQKKGRERVWEEKYARLRRDFDKVKEELERRVSSLGLVKEKAEAWKSRFEELHRRTSQDFNRVKAEKAELERRVSSVESEKEAAERELLEWKSRFEELNRRTSHDFNRVKAEKAELERRVSSVESEKEAAERELEERKSRFEELNRRISQDFDRVKAVKAELELRVSSLESEKEKEEADREVEEYRSLFEELNQRMLQLEEDTAVLMRAGRPAVAEAAAKMTGVAADGLVMDGGEGGRGKENLTELLVKESEVNCGEKANLLPGGGGSAVGSEEVGRSSQRGDGIFISLDLFLPYKYV